MQRYESRLEKSKTSLHFEYAGEGLEVKYIALYAQLFLARMRRDEALGGSHGFTGGCANCRLTVV